MATERLRKNVYLSDDIVEALEDQAHYTRTSQSEICRQGIELYIKLLGTDELSACQALALRKNVPLDVVVIQAIRKAFS